MLHLYQLKILKKGTKTSQVFEDIFSDILKEKYVKPSLFIKSNWKKFILYKDLNNVDRSVNGSVFECLISILLFRENIFPLFTQVQLAFVPNAIFDLLLYNTSNEIISLSLKTTLRERWKQADLEAFALKNVYRNSSSFLITLSENESNTVNSKIKSGGVLGLNEVILADSDNFDILIDKLNKERYLNPGAVNIFQKFTEINN
jgi:hypothetical protein